MSSVNYCMGEITNIGWSMLCLINSCNNLIVAIFDSVCITLSEELKNKPKERDNEEIFPGSKVRAPFNLSDLSRLLRRHKALKELEPIELPILQR